MIEIKKIRLSLFLLTNIICLFMTGVSQANEQPNIVLIFADDMHYGALGATGSVKTNATTPRIDSIFDTGMRFNNAYVTHATCAPSRAGIMTGRYQARFDFETLPGSTESRYETDYGVDEKEVMMPAILKQAGYETYAIGKWHLGTADKYQPNARGFDHWFGYRGASGFYQFKSELQAIKKDKKVVIKKNEKPNLDIVRNGESVQVRGYLTDAFAEEAKQLILKKKDKPFFLYFAPYNVHAPDTVPKHYIPKGGTAHDGVIAALDASVGTILDALDQADLTDNTLVVFANDNGGKKVYSTIFRGNKATYYEGGVRVPVAMQWGNKIASKSQYNGMISTLDFLPTFAKVSGAKLPEQLNLDGKDISAQLLGQKTPSDVRGDLFWRNGSHRAARVGDWKLVWSINKKKLKTLHKELGIKHYKGRQVIDAERNDNLFEPPELYNLVQDPKEQMNLAKQDPLQLATMIKAYKEWEAELPKWRH
ncbi:sulfatase-like hydrolase/transferase [Thalassotalea fonticola]|uniref:Sulfatase-like hydrolase/transferase n=1 Tax=Thalassotalea fonticola TaxID=3065649 RepID=A0ABZ0GSS0_9GAMM|nr:sulfatase-like hydrolase/transferase [Colwelliaceae bacterium S1-1]